MCESHSHVTGSKRYYLCINYIILTADNRVELNN